MWMLLVDASTLFFKADHPFSAFSFATNESVVEWIGYNDGLMDEWI